MNIMNAETKQASVHILHQHITLDQEYSTKFYHIAVEHNVGPDGLSHLLPHNEGHCH